MLQRFLLFTILHYILSKQHVLEGHFSWSMRWSVFFQISEILYLTYIFASLCNIKRRAAYVQKIEVMNISYSCFSKCTANIKIFYWYSLSIYYWAKYRRIPSIQNHFYFYCKDNNYISIQFVVLKCIGCLHVIQGFKCKVNTDKSFLQTQVLNIG